MAKNTVTALQQNAVTRMQQRVAAVLAVRQQHHAARINARNQAAFLAGVQQMAAQYGVDPKALLRATSTSYNARANSATVAPSRELIHVAGEALTPCKAVHALCATIPNATRGEMIQLCVDNGVNKATAQTQVGKFRAAAKEAAEQEAAE